MFYSFFLCHFCDIMFARMKTKISIFSIAMLLCTSSAFAGWQHNGYYVNDGSYNDDGSRFVLSLRGGLSMGNAKLNYQ